MIPNNQTLLAKLCAFYPGSDAEINHMHEKVRSDWLSDISCILISDGVYVSFLFKCGLPSLEECKLLAEGAMNKGDLFSAVKFHLLSSEPENALPIGINHVKGTGSLMRKLHVNHITTYLYHITIHFSCLAFLHKGSLLISFLTTLPSYYNYCNSLSCASVAFCDSPLHQNSCLDLTGQWRVFSQSWI